MLEFLRFFACKKCELSRARKNSKNKRKLVTWSADVININPKCDTPLQKKCNALYDYIRYVYRIEGNRKSGMEKKEAVEEAVDWAIKENLLNGFFKRQKAEVIGMSLTEFDEEEFKKVCYEDGIIDGKTQKALEAAGNLLKLNLLSYEQIAQAQGLPLEKVQEIAEKIQVNQDQKI
ncbi:MAG: hypothetical protein J5857_08580 [Treponema sp.]|nr:hypothetical protein [Treponema sp.]